MSNYISTIKAMGLSPKKSLGQNFLVTEGTLQKIANAIMSQNLQAPIVEVGPGLGFLTKQLTGKGRRLILVEKDDRFIIHLETMYGQTGEVDIVHGDILQFDLESYLREKVQAAGPVLVVGNLPYNISTKLITQLLDKKELVSELIFMVQKEVADRIVAAPGSKTYGRLTIFCQLHAVCKKLFNVSKNCFYPSPKVDSSIVSLTPNQFVFSSGPQAEIFYSLVKTCFGQRRKMLRNSLLSWLRGRENLADFDLQNLPTGVNLKERPENMPIQQYLKISEVLAGWRIGENK